MAHEVTDKYAARDAFVSKQLAEAEVRMERWVEEHAQKLRMTHAMRQAVERVSRKVFGSRKYLVLPRNSPTRQKFLKLMLTFVVAYEPALLERLREVARYLDRNYPYEWCISPVTRLARQRARDLILSNADSEFGETPLAPPFAYARHHPEEARLEHIANYGEVYTRALTLVQTNYFFDRDAETRRKLGLGDVAVKEEALAERERIMGLRTGGPAGT